jgi:hypothetical protein
MKLTQEKIVTIKKFLVAGIEQRAIARATEINPSTISTVALVLNVGKRKTASKAEKVRQ